MPKVERIEFQGKSMILTFNGQEHRIDLSSVSVRLANASEMARGNFSVSPSGYGIHWPEIDEDLSVDGLIAAACRSEPVPRKV